jgi:hypothetical protein
MLFHNTDLIDVVERLDSRYQATLLKQERAVSLPVAF